MSVSPLRLAFVVESGTDVRLIEGLAKGCATLVLSRRIVGGREISQPTSATFTSLLGPSSFVGFGTFVFRWLLTRRREIDVVLVQGYGVAALAANLASRLTRRPAIMLVCSPTEEYYACRRAEPAGRPYRALEALALRVLARVNGVVGRHYIVLSPYLASVIQRHATHPEIDVIPVYGVDTTVFKPSDEPRTTVRKRLGLPEKAALVFFSSRIAPEKDPRTLLAAIRQLRAEDRDVRLLHLSGGYRELIALAAKAGLEDAVIARDALAPFESLAEWYHAADVCVQASRAEGLGFSVLEALACGTPVIAANVGGLRDTIREHDTGWTYPPGDVGALAAALRDVLERPDEGRRRAARGRDLVLRAYERDQVFTALGTLLERQRQCAAGRQVPQDAVVG